QESCAMRRAIHESHGDHSGCPESEQQRADFHRSFGRKIRTAAPHGGQEGGAREAIHAAAEPQGPERAAPQEARWSGFAGFSPRGRAPRAPPAAADQKRRTLEMALSPRGDDPPLPQRPASPRAAQPLAGSAGVAGVMAWDASAPRPAASSPRPPASARTDPICHQGAPPARGG
ncbi:unnamed protein product, partial [Prorocentrum cordatum]